MIEKLITLLSLDSDIAGSTIAGSITESLVHPSSKKVLLMHFFRALSVGWLLATFVSPAIAHRFSLNKAESIAIAFIGGYAGVKILNTGEKALLKAINNKRLDV